MLTYLQQNEKCHWISHFFDFNDKPILLLYDDVITLSYPTQSEWICIDGTASIAKRLQTQRIHQRQEN